MRVFKPKFKPPVDAEIDPEGNLGEGFISWKNKRNEFLVVSAHYTADPEKRSDEWYRQATKNLRPDQIDREYEIDFESKAGQKAFWYLEPNSEKFRIADIPLDDINPRWRIIAGLDYGSTNPTAFHIYGVDEMRRVYALFEFYKPSNYREIAEVIKGTHKDFPHPLYKRIEKIMVDPSIYKKDQLEPMKEEMTSIGDILREEFGVWKLQRGQNDRKAGLERVKDMLNYRPHDPEWVSNLYFCQRCEKLWWELNNLVYEEIPPHLLVDKNQSEDVKKKDDHAYDELRYALMSISAPAAGPPEAIPLPGTFGDLERKLDFKDDSEDPDFI